MKGDYMAKKYSFGSIMKKKFSDITNSLQQHNSPAIVKMVPPDSYSDQDLVDNIIKENLALVKLIQDKNKIIEMKGTEIQIQRTNIQKMQMQNWNLAQVNSHMTAELNLGKRKLKSLQHELSCKEAFLKVKNEDLKMAEVIIIPADMKALDENGKSTNHSRCRGLPRSRSLGHTISTQRGVDKDDAENKRHCIKRQSTNLRSHNQSEEETIGKLLEIEVTNFSPSSSTHFNRPESRSSCSSISGRPMRKAAEKVESYKETPLNLKMRRND